MVLRLAFENVIGAVGEQGFDNRQHGGWRACLALLFLMRNADAVVQGACPCLCCNAFESFQLIRCDEFATFVASGDKCIINIDLRERGCQVFPCCCCCCGFAGGDGFQTVDFGIALEHFEAHANFMDAVV